MVTPALSWASRVLAPRWGVTTTDSSSNSGDSVVGSTGEHVEGGPRHPAGGDGLGQRRLVDDPAPSGVDDS